ncbi:MAG: 50S ribosomal protein L21 [Firmicutes bacterium]|jgi:large subunit ribosomal protein L21|nr:50S ribosomal protein L21 [Bacillota bacterium]
MYAVIASGGKQEKVEVGSIVELELLSANIDEEVTLAPVLLVDGANIVASPKLLEKTSVKGKVLGETKGKKIVGFTYRPKARARRRFGHRQHYSQVEITEINLAAK